jgi:hypothetical protein
MLTEDYGIVYKATSATPTSSSVLDKLKSVFEPPYSTVYWEKDVAVADPDYLLIKSKFQDWTSLGKALPSSFGLDDPNLQQILFHATANNLFITYAPKGGINGVNYTNLWAPGVDVTYNVLTSGRRPITGYLPSNFDSTRMTGQFYFVEYRDQSRRTNWPASAILLAFQSSDKPDRWLVGAHVGSILLPDNRNDVSDTSSYGYKLTGDGIMVGAMTAYDGSSGLTSDGLRSWWRSESNNLVGDNPNNTTAFRIGNTWFNFDHVPGNLLEDLDYRVPTNAILSNLNGSRRLMPLNFYYKRTSHVGTTKYMRITNTRFITNSPTLMDSLTPGSQQSWAGWYDFNYGETLSSESNTAILWNKNVIIIS